MRGLKKRNNFLAWFFSNISVIVLIVVFVLVWHGVWKVYKKEVQSRGNVGALVQEEEVLKERKIELEERVASLETETGKVKEIREKFDVVREGEQVVVLVDAPDTATTTLQKEEKGLFGKMWESLKNIF